MKALTPNGMNAPAPLGLVRYSQSGGGVGASCLKLHDSRSPAAPSTFAHRRGAAKDFLWCLSRVEFFCVKDFCLARLGHPFPHFFWLFSGFLHTQPIGISRFLASPSIQPRKLTDILLLSSQGPTQPGFPSLTVFLCLFYI